MPHKAAPFVLAAVAIGCAHGEPAPALPPAVAPAASGPATDPSLQALLDAIVRIELNRNCFGTPTAPATAPSSAR